MNIDAEKCLFTSDQSDAYVWNYFLTMCQNTLNTDIAREPCDLTYEPSSWVELLHESYAGPISYLAGIIQTSLS